MAKRTTQKRIHGRRSGITLLEVLISIGVLSVGLLGVMALMPAASQQAKAGIEQDAAAVLGRRAFREMNVRWASYDAMYNPAGPADRFYCIDPLGQVFSGELANLAATPVARNSTKVGEIKPIAGNVSANRVILRDPLLPGLNKAITNPLLINEIFRSKDDLSFGDFASREDPAPNPPQQIALKDNGVGVKRSAKGNLSWFATVVQRNPGFDTVSVAIVKNRKGDEFTEPVSSAAPIVGGMGEIEIPISGTGEEAWSKVKSGHWVLLTNLVGNAEWYRIHGIGRIDNDGDGTDDHRALTVVGPNWISPAGAMWPDTQLILIPEVIAVYSRSQAR